MFRGHLNDRQRYQAAFADGWYLTGDLARRDQTGGTRGEIVVDTAEERGA